MAGNKQFVKLSDIQCETIVEKIKECTIIIERFRNVLSKHLKYKELESPQIFITRTSTMTFEDDGNTRANGYEYKVYWCFPYININENVDISRLLFYEKYMWSKCLLFFSLNITERIRDHKCKGGHFFKLYLTEELEEKNTISEIICYNDNYSLRSMLKVENIYTCIKKINEVYDRISLKQTLLEDLCEGIDISNSEEYIELNCRVTC